MLDNSTINLLVVALPEQLITLLPQINRTAGADFSFITVHCSATPSTQDIGVAEIRRWHKNRGWRDVGYHFVIRRCGKVEIGRPLSQTGAHVKGHNKGNIGVCLVGGCNAVQQPEDNFTFAQRKALFGLIEVLQKRFLIVDNNVKGHKDWGVNKACPVMTLRGEGQMRDSSKRDSKG
ncbi:N-acetylmuramoyl-L-alanine amidase [Vibrio pelagius]|uniref:N-acetylmuramoyl-L-alanine amidase n=1 Tax=Vibrio pelagius TaxID=28169 RepID=A0ABY5G7C4_VIBPE|nr:N-acetylmuramoyl-L-alanine amidase [Vibrio pelagius]UTT85783.1 N-acetylmuramoyl-L-alanine amidase [Vibrio pelagius]